MDPTQSDLIYQALLEKAGLWVAMPHLMTVSGSANIHTRINELRHQHGHHIQNKQQRIPGRRTRASFYRLILPEPQPTTPHP
jgi:hypothetical protein